MTIRGQLIVWDMRAEPKSDFKITNYAGVGIVEAPTGTLPEHQMHGFIGLADRDGGLLLPPTGHMRDISTDVRAHEIGYTVTNPIWPRPSPASGVNGGGFYFRRTRMPAPIGREILMIAIVATLDSGELANNHRYDLSANARPLGLPGHGLALKLTKAENLDDQIETGQSLAQLLKNPIWGWNAEKFGFVSTMDLQTIDECQRYDDLISEQKPSAEQQAEIEELNHTEAGWILCNHRHDVKFAHFTQQMNDHEPPYRWDGFVTAASEQRREKIAKTIIQRLMA